MRKEYLTTKQVVKRRRIIIVPCLVFMIIAYFAGLTSALFPSFSEDLGSVFYRIWTIFASLAVMNSAFVVLYVIYEKIFIEEVEDIVLQFEDVKDVVEE